MKYTDKWDLTSIPEPEFVAERNRRIAVNRTTPPRAKVLRACVMCGEEFGAREMLKHTPRCPQNPRRASGIEIKLD